MELAATVILATLTLVMSEVSSLKCYHCTINPPGKHEDSIKRLCSHFDHSDKFIVDCPYSTMCVKQEIQLEIQNGVRITGVMRDCAPQKNTYHDYRNGEWHERTDIVEPYKEECRTTDDKGARTPHSSYCYCKSSLCNSAPKSNHEGYTDIMGVIMVFNLMKYIRSLR